MSRGTLTRYRPLAVVVTAAAGLVLVWWAVARVGLPDVPEVAFADGTAPVVRDDVRQARRAVVAARRSAAAWGEYGLTLRAYDFPAEADVALAAAAALDPAEPKWPYLLGTRAVVADPPRAIGWFEKALAADPADAAVRETVRCQLAEALLATDRVSDAKAALGAGPFASPRAKLIAARIALHEEDDPTAAEYLLEVHDHPPAARQALALEAQLYSRQGRPAFAAHTGRLAAQAPEVPWPDPFADEVLERDRTRSGRAAWATRLMDRNQYAEADRVLAPLAVDSPTPRVHLVLAQAQAASGDHARAIATLKNGSAVHPKDGPIRYNLGLLLFDDGEKLRNLNRPDEAKARFAEAVAAFDAVPTADPAFGKALLLKGTALHQFLGRPQEGLALVKQYVAEHPEAGEGYFLLGRLCAAGNDRAGAAEAFRRADLLAGPDDTRAAQALADLDAPQR